MSITERAAMRHCLKNVRTQTEFRYVAGSERGSSPTRINPTFYQTSASGLEGGFEHLISELEVLILNDTE